jgi:ACS family tartrate transporter-like MFS transporter
MYVVAYLDRANVAFAKLSMSADLGFSEAVYGFGSGIFYVGYLLLEIPGALLVERWSARRWMARILVSWGVCTMLVGAVHTPVQFYGARFLLGLAEAGFYPGIIVYLSHWFAAGDRARAYSILVISNPVASILGASLSGLILQLDWLGVAGWRWVFILEGIPAVLLGLYTLRAMTDRPAQAAWLTPDERAWIMDELAAERLRKAAVSGEITTGRALRDRNVLLLALALFVWNLNGYAFVLWLPTVIQKASGLSDAASSALSALPYAAGLVAVIAASRSSDRSGERRWHCAIPLAFVALFFNLSAVPGQSFWLVMVWLCLTSAASYAWATPFWVLPTLALRGAAAAAAIGMINMIGNVSGFVSPSVVGALLSRGFTFAQIIPGLSLCALTAALLILSVRLPKTNEEATPGGAAAESRGRRP